MLSAEDDGCTPRCGYLCYMTSKMEDDAGRWSAIVWQNNPVSMFFKAADLRGNREQMTKWTIAGLFSGFVGEWRSMLMKRLKALRTSQGR